MTNDERYLIVSRAKSLLDSTKTLGANIDTSVATPNGIEHPEGDLLPSLLRVRAAIRLLEKAGVLPHPPDDEVSDDEVSDA